jgi:predicted DNA-binding protein
MYELSILAMFKNESWIIREWIEHYIIEGVEHFYLIDNGSTDNYEEKIKDYMDKISLVKDSTRLPYGTQSFLYKKIFLNKIKEETKWLIICDIDEYIYARNSYKSIIDVLERLPSNIETIWLPWKIFGSNNHDQHPNGIINNFTKRSNQPNNFLGHGKSILKTKNLVNFGCCGHYVEIRNNTNIYTPNGDNYYIFNFTEENCSKFNLHLNHYMLLSKEYYLKIKCSRGGGESGLTNKYSINFFIDNDKNYNIINDNELLIKKKLYIEKLNKYLLNNMNILNKYLNNATFILQIYSNNSEKIIYNASLKSNLKKIVSIENNNERFHNINNIMIDKNNFINIFSNNTNNNWISMLNNNILSNIDLIYIDNKIENENIYVELFNIINNKCYIILNNKNKIDYNLFLKYFKISEIINNDDLIILVKIN